jgi:hypothetical protein
MRGLYFYKPMGIPVRRKLEVLILLAACMLITGCAANSRNKCNICPAAPPIIPYLSFRVVDKTSGNDLFFGAAAVYKTSQLKLNHLVNGVADSVHVFVNSTDHDFQINVSPIHNVDTVTMNIASLPQDVFLFKTSTSTGCCPTLIFNAVLFDGNVVYTPAGGPNVVVIAK